MMRGKLVKFWGVTCYLCGTEQIVYVRTEDECRVRLTRIGWVKKRRQWLCDECRELDPIYDPRWKR